MVYLPNHHVECFVWNLFWNGNLGYEAERWIGHGIQWDSFEHHQITLSRWQIRILEDNVLLVHLPFPPNKHWDFWEAVRKVANTRKCSSLNENAASFHVLSVDDGMLLGSSRMDSENWVVLMEVFLFGWDAMALITSYCTKHSLPLHGWEASAGSRNWSEGTLSVTLRNF